MCRWIAASLSALCFVMAPQASAQLAINQLWVDLESGTAARADLVIRNESEDRYYISVQASEIMSPGTEQEARVEIADPEQLGLLVTPSRLIMEPGATRSIRVVSLNQDTDRDRVYRVLIRPEVGAILAPEAPAGETGVAIKLLASYDVLVIARPPQGEARVEMTRSASEAVLRNTGNSNTLLLDGRICPAGVSAQSQDDRCRALPAYRLYAGGQVVVPLNSPDESIFVREQRRFSADPRDVSF